VFEVNYNEFSSLIVGQSGSICYICDVNTYEILHLTKAGMDACGLTSPDEYRGKKSIVSKGFTPFDSAAAARAEAFKTGMPDTP